MRVLVQQGDAMKTAGDVLVLKYAQALHGADREAWRLLGGGRLESWLPAPGVAKELVAGDVLGAGQLVFLGTPPLQQIRYDDLRDFGRRSLEEVARRLPQARRIVQTIHGPGFGLDETEAFKSQLAGLQDAVAAGHAPLGLEEVLFVELAPRRVQRLRAVLEAALPGGLLQRVPAPASRSLVAPDEKRRVFVAMPFAPEFDDLFHYGIQGAVNAADLLAERADTAHFTGDVMQWVKERIAGASLVVADLSGGNPNVFLEVGYAWGRDVRTVLLLRQGETPRFDVAGQRLLMYTSIKHLETQLAAELKALN